MRKAAFGKCVGEEKYIQVFCSGNLKGGNNFD
jgi:hypothetical protein